jgi:hypothetical protein
MLEYGILGNLEMSLEAKYYWSMQNKRKFIRYSEHSTPVMPRGRPRTIYEGWFTRNLHLPMRYKQLFDEFYRKARESRKKVYEALAEAVKLYLEIQEAGALNPEQAPSRLPDDCPAPSLEQEYKDFASNANREISYEELALITSTVASADKKIMEQLRFIRDMDPQLAVQDSRISQHLLTIYKSRREAVALLNKMVRKRNYDGRMLEPLKKIVSLDILSPEVKTVYNEWLKMNKT